MKEILSILLIAVALSMDTFSASLSLGTAGISLKKGCLLSIITGIMHFIMPLLGMSIGHIVLKFLTFDPHFFLGIIFFVLSFKMFYDTHVSKEENIYLNMVGIFLFSLSVSFDAFTTGIGILAITKKIITATFIFMLVSYLFTMMGILLGRYVNQKLGKISSYIGIIILFLMALHLII